MADDLNSAMSARQNIPYGSIGDIGGSSAGYYNTSVFPLIDRALSAYSAAQQGQTKPLDIYTQLEGAAGLPQLRKTSTTLQASIGNIEDALKRVDPNVSMRSRNSIVTEAQRSGMVSAESAPLNERLSELGTSLGRVQQGIQSGESNLGTKVGLVMKGQENDLNTFKLTLDTMSERAAQLISGFDNDRQYEYNFLMDKLSRQRTLADSEWSRLVDLQKLKQSHDYELDNIKAQGDQSMRMAEYKYNQDPLGLLG